jgi:hypothetical protein
VSTATFVAMRRRSALWGIHAQIVQAVVAEREWQGDEPFDIGRVLGFGPAPNDAACPVLLVGGGDKTSPIRALGAVALRQLELSSVLPVPSLARSPDKPQPVAGVAFVEGGVPLLVLDPIALLALAEERGKP